MRYISDNQTAACEALEFAVSQAKFAIDTTSHITHVEQFLQTTIGMVYYNSACMCIQTIGESFRKVDELTNGHLRSRHPEIPWREIIAMRNYISHEYSNTDPETIFQTIKVDLLELIPIMESLITELQKD
ncbi:MAG: DUF86 domain-containing protein [Bacteroidales bacterium]|nr:DUF86 domain-containing protein [Bacteroidales bacterium]MBQ8812725.1 DUF86 domain-containing protein [Bacteroidales bacterium]